MKIKEAKSHQNDRRSVKTYSSLQGKCFFFVDRTRMSSSRDTFLVRLDLPLQVKVNEIFYQLLNNTTSEIPQKRSCWPLFLDCSKVEHISLTLMKGEEKAFWFALMLLKFYVDTWTSEETSEEFLFVRYFAITALTDNFGRALNCLWLQWATRHEFYHNLIANVHYDDTVGIEE